MDQEQIEIITVNDRISAEIEKSAGAAVGEAFNAHDGSKEADSGSQPRNLYYTSDAQEVQEEREIFTAIQIEIWGLTRAKGYTVTGINLWIVANEEFTNRLKRAESSFYKGEEEIRSVKNEIYQVVGFFSAFQGLLITAAAQSILLRCNNVGFMLALSAYATAVAVFGIWQKITAMEELRLANNRNKHHMEVSPYNIFFLIVVASIQHSGATFLKE
jgi:hypothetical protein